MAINLKKALLTGTALVAVSFSALQAHAGTHSPTADGQVWADDFAANSGDSLDIDSYDAIITNNGTADDGTNGTDAFVLGNVVDFNASPNGTLTITTGESADLSVNIGGAVGVEINGAFNVTGVDANDASITTLVAHNFSVDSLNISNDESDDAGHDVLLSVGTSGGNTDNFFAGSTSITAGSAAGANAILAINSGGDYDDEDGLGNVAVDFGSGAVLNDSGDDTKGIASIVFDTNGSDDVFGTIDGGGNNEGTIVLNTDQTFHGDIGATKFLHKIDVSNTDSTYFYGTVDAATIHFSDAGELEFSHDVNTASNGTIDFDGQDGDVEFTSDFGGGSTINVGGDIIDSSNTGKGSVYIDNDMTVIVSGSLGSATGKLNQIEMNYDSSLTVGGDIGTANGLSIGYYGTLTLNGGTKQTVTGAINNGDGYGQLTVSNTSVAGAIFNGTVDVQAITVNSIAGNATATFNDEVHGDSLILGGDGHAGDVNTVIFGGNANVYVDIAGADSIETNNITIAGGGSVNVYSDIGANINNIQIGADGANSSVAFYGNIASGNITIGGDGTDGDVNTVTFAAYDHNVTLNNKLQGADAEDTNNIVINGNSDYSVTQEAAWTTKLTNLTINDTNFISDNDITLSGLLTVNGGMVTSNSGTITADIALDSDSGLTLVGGNVTGDIYGQTNHAGSVNVEDATATVSGSLGTSGAALDEITLIQSTLNIGGDLYANGTYVIGSDSTLVFNGTLAQNVDSYIGGEGSMVVANAAGVTFSDAEIELGGDVTIDKTAGNSSATFNGYVTADNIILGGDGHAGDVNTATFDSYNIINAVVKGANSTETNNVVVAGGADVHFVKDIGANIASIQIGADGANTDVTFLGNVKAETGMTAGTFTIGGDTTDGDTNNVTFDTYYNNIIIDRALVGADAQDVNTITVTGPGTVTQNVASTTNLNTLDVTGGSKLVSAANLTFSGAVNVDEDSTFSTTAGTVQAASITLNDNGALSLDGGSIKANVAGGSAGEGSLTATANGTITGTLGALGSLSITGTGHTLTVTGNANAADLTDIAGNTLSVTAGTFTLDAGQELDVAITGSTTIGHVTASGNATVDEDATIVVTRANDIYVADGTKFVIIDGNDAGTGVADLGTNLDLTGATSALLSFTQDTDDEGNFVIVATRKSISEVEGGSLSSEQSNVTDILESLTGDTAIDAVLGKLQAAVEDGDTKGAQHIIDSVTPDVSGQASIAANSFGESVQHIAQTRMFNVMHGETTASNPQEGVAAGSGTNGASFWVQAFGQKAKQDMRDGVAGYDADSFGTAMGLDTTKLIKNGVLGISFNYGKTNADAKDANTTGTDIDSYGVNLYASKDLAQGYFVNGQIGYAYNDISNARHDVGGLGGTANADYSSDLYSAQLAGGKDYAAGHGLTVTPSLSASYLHLATDGYTETGSGAPLLTVDAEDADSLKVGAGLTAMWNLKNDAGAKLKPSISAGYAYDLLSDNVESTSHFLAGGPAFKTQGADPARGEFNAGAGLIYSTPANWDLSANYDYTYKSDYAAHTGIVRGTVHF